MLPYIVCSLLNTSVLQQAYQNSAGVEGTHPTDVSIPVWNVMVLEMNAAMPSWKSQLEVKREGPRYGELRMYAMLQLCRKGLWASEVVFDGHVERMWLGRSQAMNQMNPRGLISEEHSVTIGKLLFLAEPRTTNTSRTAAGAR